MSSPIKPKTRGSALVIVLIIVAVIAILGAIGYVLLGKKSGGASTGIGSIFHKTITATNPSDIKALLTNAKAGKYDARCTYTTNAKNPDDSTLYVAGAKKLHADFPINNKPGHLVRIDDSAYLWADGDDKGSKLPMKDASEGGKYTPDEFSKKAEEYHMKCEGVDKLSDTLFTLPSNVTFDDFNATVKSYSYGN